MLQASLCFRFLQAVAGFLQETYKTSLTGRLVNRSAAVLRGWAGGSVLVRFFWVEDALSLWHGSRTFAVFSRVTAHTRALLERLSLLLLRASGGSIAVRLLRGTRQALGTRPLALLLEVFLVFLAANLLIRLLGQAYSTFSLLVLSGALLGTLLLRAYTREVTAALTGSRSLALVRWFFTPTEEDER